MPVNIRLICKFIVDFWRPYVSEEGALKLKQYKYQGGDTGFVYRFLYNPLALKIVEHTPEYIAPNLITLIGFFFTIIPFLLLFGLYSSDFDGPVPAWWCILQAFCYFMARLLDEMDGKQARKTGNSSPVGLLFDHGCDSFTCALLTMMMTKMLQLGNSNLILWILLGTTQSFHFCTLEEYYIGGLYLGPFNGVSDGSAPIIAIFLFTGIVGNDWWIQEAALPVFGSMRYSHILAYCIIFSQFIAVMLNIYSAVKHSMRTDLTQEERSHGEPLNYMDLTQQIVAFYILYYVVLMAASMRGPQFLHSNPLLPALVFTSIYTHNTISIQVAHVTKQKYTPWTNPYMFGIVLLSLYSVFEGLEVQIMSPQAFFITVLIMLSICQCHFIYFVIDEMTDILQIRVFRVKDKQIQLDSIDQFRVHQSTTGIEMPEITSGKPGQYNNSETQSPQTQSSPQKFNYDQMV